MKIKCTVCGRALHSLPVHLKASHNMTVAAYRVLYPEAPIMSDEAIQRLSDSKKKGARKAPAITAATAAMLALPEGEVMAFGVARLALRTPSPDEAKWVPEHDEHFDLDDAKLEAAALAVQCSENVLAVGPTGCGKSAFFLELAALLNQPVRRLNLHGDVRAADFVGEKVVDVDAATGQAIVMWRDGILPDAMRRGHWLLLDELDSAPPSILFVLQAVLEEHRRLVLSANHGEVIDAHPDFRVIATANTLGKGDETGLYTGTQVLNEAFLDRFGTVMEWDYPDAKTEAKIIIAKTGIDPSMAMKMVEAARMVRNGNEKEECFCTFSLRRLLRWAAKTVALKDHKRAGQLTVLNKLSEDDRKYVGNIIQRVLG